MNYANILTSMRIVLSLFMLFIGPDTNVFWICFICCGLSDMFDGYVARRFNQESVAGARLDSIADVIFAAVIMVTVVINVVFPLWLWICIIAIVVLRLMGYVIGFIKYHAFSSLHTYANKVTGAVIFVSPVLYYVAGLEIAGVIVCMSAALSSVEEIVITVRSDELERDCKGLFF